MNKFTKVYTYDTAIEFTQIKLQELLDVKATLETLIASVSCPPDLDIEIEKVTYSLSVLNQKRALEVNLLNL